MPEAVRHPGMDAVASSSIESIGPPRREVLSEL